LNLVCVNSYDDLSLKAAKLILEQVKGKKKLTLGLATGATPIGIYHYMIEEHKQNKTSFNHVTTFNLDEYIGIHPTDQNSYHYYMDKYLFSQLDIPKNQIHIPNGYGLNLQEECMNYENSILKTGGIDIQILGLGENGHIGFNEPGVSLNSFTQIVELTESTRRANAKYFNGIDDVPTHAITMGISSILNSKEILLVVSGKKKAKALATLLNCRKVDPSFPASALIQHNSVTIIAEKESVSQLACV
jgi:glucosamine-6-phosphate deaminase